MVTLLLTHMHKYSVNDIGLLFALQVSRNVISLTNVKMYGFLKKQI